ncbi:MAG: hypothetical protein H8Z69_03720 [Nanohaloarchaea archaeon]|nr:hypothetical protein [Candidatus Nanohaloarchaea archaeon]
MKTALVRIHARLWGDGYASFYETNERDCNRRAIVVYTNVVDENLREFREDMNKIFDVDMYRYEEEVKSQIDPNCRRTPTKGRRILVRQMDCGFKNL